MSPRFSLAPTTREQGHVNSRRDQDETRMLQQHVIVKPPIGTNEDIIQIDSDSEDDEQLRQAIALSLQDQSNIPAESSRDDKEDPSAAAGPLPQKPKTQFGSLFLDRKAMEEERLKRLGKRPRSSSGDGITKAPPPKRLSPYPPSRSDRNEESKEDSINAYATIASTSVPYPDGTVKRTWARGCNRNGTDIKIEEVLQKDQLQLAVISSFQWDEEWMLSKIDISKTNILLLAFAKDDTQKEVMRANVPPSIKFCFPPMYGMGAMHSKLQILKYAGYLRIVIPTGNFVPYDWGETGVMENMVFLIDLPRLENPVGQKPTMFQKELEYFLKAMGVSDRMIASISNYDFLKTENLGFVHTIPGGHMDESLRRVGYCGLGASVAALGLASPELIEVDLACASLGSLNREFIAAIYNACQGNEGIPEGSARPSRKPGAKVAAPIGQLQDRFRIYFPTEQTVLKSRGGQQAGGTLCVQAKWWRSPSFPTELMRDMIATRDRLLVHTKVIFVRRPQCGKTTVGQSPGWAYVGSANLSESAWGRLSKDKATGKAKLSCRNWECGVVVPLPKEDGKSRPSTDITMFAGIVPIPMQVPGPTYGPDEQPWFYSGA
ncbi:Tyrosyl-DNA phosphodiesterase 1-like protein [Cladobotryum mycophilum]|uniref:Tyrosyl-DNA phosphodiesterase 1-like protein n=1 Tax=Cladobotryum mycophilum TaxID=491253 RepID=A0ABR0T064_9HYPO